MLLSNSLRVGYLCILLSMCRGNNLAAGSTLEDNLTPSTATQGVAISSTTAVRAPGAAIPIQLAAGYGAKLSNIDIYFTNPNSVLASQETGGPDGPLILAIDAARLSIDLAMYNLNLENISTALLRAHDRGVRVRVVMDSDNQYQDAPQRLVAADIPLVGDGREGLMHDKFMVIDNSEVWTGSLNFTHSGAYEDNNDLVRIHSVELAASYTREFEEMFVVKGFGTEGVSDSLNPRIILDGIPIDVYFSPDDHPEAVLLDLIQNAGKSIEFMVYSFTSDPLGKALRRRASEGIKVQGVMDADKAEFDMGSEFISFLQANLDVRKDGNEGLMHHKMMVIDGEIVVLGSYNFTKNAENMNDENLLVIYNSVVADIILDEYRRILTFALN